MASYESAFRPLLPDVFPDYVNDDHHALANAVQIDVAPSQPAKIVSLQAYKALRSLKECGDTQKIHNLDLMLPLIDEARLRPVRFYRGLEEWLLEQKPDPA